MESVNPSPLSIQGGLLRFSGESSSPPPRPDGVKRGCIDAMSSGSRYRLCKFFAGLDWGHYARSGTPYKHLTLSTGPEFWGQELHVYQSFKRFVRWLKRQDGYEGHIVRREVGSRKGMLHFHVLVFGPSWIPAGEIRAQWRKALRAERVQRIHIEDVPGERVSRYLSKYVAKAAYAKAESQRPAPTDDGGDYFGEINPTVVGAAGVVGDARPLSLSEWHNRTEGSVAGASGASADVNALGFARSSEGFTGRRWWYYGGVVRRAERVFLRSVDARTIAAHVRRIYRKVLRARVLRRVLSRGGSWERARREVKTWERSRQGGFWFRGLAGRGFALMASPELLSKCVQSAISRRDSVVEECMGDEIGLRELDLIGARMEHREAHALLCPFGVSADGRPVVWGATRYQDADRVLTLLESRR